MNDKVNNKDYLDDFLDCIETNLHTPVVSTGFESLDSKLNGGLYPGLYVIGAISSLGKTALCLNIADNIAMKGNGVLFFSLEMPRNELLARSISRLMFENNPKKCKEISTNKVLYGSAKEYNKDEFYKAFELYEEKIFPNLKIIECNFDTTHKKIRDDILKYIEKTGRKPVVFIDYLQIINICKEDMTEKRGIDNIVKALKQLSRDLSLIIFVVSSFNRENYNSPVSFASFKESGGIEYTSDFVLGLQLTLLDNLEKEAKDRISLNKALEEAKKGDLNGCREVSLKILKNRNGKSNVIHQFKFYGKNNFWNEIKQNDYRASLVTVEQQQEIDLNNKKIISMEEAKNKEKIREKVIKELTSKKHKDEIISEIDKQEIIKKELAELRKKELIRKAKEEARIIFEKESKNES